MTDWSVDLAASFATQDDEMHAPALASGSAPLQADGSPEPESSSASELDDFAYLTEFPADALLASMEDAEVLLDHVALNAGEKPASAHPPSSARQRSPLEESWVHTLIEMDDSAASTHATCSPDGSDAFELRDEPMGDNSADGQAKLTISTEACPTGPAGPNGTPPGQDAAGHKRKAEVEFPPVGAARTAGMMAPGVAGLAVPGLGGAVPAVGVGGVILPSPGAAAQHRFTDAELAKLDLETSRANDIVATLMARDPSTLSVEEVKLMKKHKRLIKNRESAQLSRQRKKNHLETLEVQVQQLEKERASLSARLERMAEENAFLKKQLLAQGRMPPAATHPPATPAPTAAAVATAAAAAAALVAKGKIAVPVTPMVAPHAMAPVKGAAPAAPPKAKAPRGSVLLAVCLFAGMFFTSVDLFQDRLPQLYTAPDAVDMPRGYEAAGGMAGRGTGRVLLAVSGADESVKWGDKSGQGAGRSRDLDIRDLLVVTLLDHLVSQLGKHASPSLFSRVCRKLVDMKVLKGCDFLAEDGGIDAVRAQYMDEFAELNDVFVKDSEAVRMDAEFTFANKKHPQAGNALTKSISSAPPRPPPTMPIAGIAGQPWDTMGLNELLRRRDSDRNERVTNGETGKEWRMLCPDAQLLLIADKPANEDMSVAARLSRKQRKSKLSPKPRLLNNGTATEDDESDPLGLAGKHPLSMIVPRRAISDSRFANRLPKQKSDLVEVQCKNFDLFPLVPTASSAVAAV